VTLLRADSRDSRCSALRRAAEVNERGYESRSRVCDAPIEGVASKESARWSERLLLTMREVAERLAVGRSTVYELRARGELEIVHIGRCARVPVGALDAFLAHRRAATVTKR
jgi:excisionase family DNA binding protein